MDFQEIKIVVTFQKPDKNVMMMYACVFVFACA